MDPNNFISPIGLVPNDLFTDTFTVVETIINTYQNEITDNDEALTEFIYYHVFQRAYLDSVNEYQSESTNRVSVSNYTNRPDMLRGLADTHYRKYQIALGKDPFELVAWF